MNKKKGLLLIVIVNILLLIVSCVIIVYKQHKQELKRKEEDRAERITIIQSTYSNYMLGEKLECDDDLCEHLNNIIDIHQKINDLEVPNINLSTINNIDISLEDFNNLKYDLDSLEYDDINKYLKKYDKYEKNAFLDIYNKSEITNSFEEDIIVKKSLLDKIDNNINILKYLIENDDSFISNNYRVIYLNEDFKNSFLSFGLDIPLISIEEAYGKKIPILTYHGVDDNVWGNSSLFVKPSNFEQQMQYLYDNGYTTLFLSEIGQAVNYDKPVIVTFDDGYLDMYTIAFPIMKSLNIKSNMFIITDWMDGEVYMNSEMVKELSNSNLVEIGSHTVSHVHLNALSYDDQEYQLYESKRFLESLIGKSVNTIAYPYGQRNIDTLNIAKKYYQFAVTTESGANYAKTYSGSSLILKRYNMQRGTSFESFKNFVA